MTAKKADLWEIAFHRPPGVFSIQEFARRYQISYEELGRATGFSRRAISNWAEGRKPSLSTARRLNEIKRLFAALENLETPEAIGPWLRNPNAAFDASTPLQVIERGESDRVWRMVCELEI
jgi:transcriptional regulator with XRE-family HTH domain